MFVTDRLWNQPIITLDETKIKWNDKEGDLGRCPGYVNFRLVILKTEVCFPRRPRLLGMTSRELEWQSVMTADKIFRMASLSGIYKHLPLWILGKYIPFFRCVWNALSSTNRRETLFRTSSDRARLSTKRTSRETDFCSKTNVNEIHISQGLIQGVSFSLLSFSLDETN